MLTCSSSLTLLYLLLPPCAGRRSAHDPDSVCLRHGPTTDVDRAGENATVDKEIHVNGAKARAAAEERMTPAGYVG